MITWKDNSIGKITKFPRVKESHKDVSFTDWEIQIKKPTRVVLSARKASNNIIQTINDNIWYASFIQRCSPRNMPEIDDLQLIWHESLAAREQRIRQLLNLNWDAYWTYLVKPQSQLMTL